MVFCISEFIIIYGNGEDIHIFDKIVPLLSQSYTVYSIDTRGHGKSSNVKELHYADMAQDIYDFIHALELEQKLMLNDTDISDIMLKQITIPTFITCGSKDVIKQSHILALHKNIPHSQLKIFTNETHSSYIVNSPAARQKSRLSLKVNNIA